MHQDIKITEEQKKLLTPYIPDLERILSVKEVEEDRRAEDDFFIVLNFAIVEHFDENFEATGISNMLERLFDEILWQTKYSNENNNQ